MKSVHARDGRQHGKPRGHPLLSALGRKYPVPLAHGAGDDADDDAAASAAVDDAAAADADDDDGDDEDDDDGDDDGDDNAGDDDDDDDLNPDARPRDIEQGGAQPLACTAAVVTSSTSLAGPSGAVPESGDDVTDARQAEEVQIEIDALRSQREVAAPAPA